VIRARLSDVRPIRHIKVSFPRDESSLPGEARDCHMPMPVLRDPSSTIDTAVPFFYNGKSHVFDIMGEEETTIMALWGTIVNTLAVLAGSLLGSFLPQLPERLKNTIMQGLGLAVIVLGMTMAFETENILITIGSLVLGGLTGEWLKLDDRLNALGRKLEQGVNRVLKGRGAKGSGSIAQGFVTATLVYCIGAMAILGAIDGGLRHNHDILYTKSMLDGISSIIFASTLGIGVMFSAIPIFLYQGSIALAAGAIMLAFSESSLQAIITEVTAVGGILIIGIGLGVLNIKSVNVANLLPAIVYAGVFGWLTLQF
jgi:hypothetical protein